MNPALAAALDVVYPSREETYLLRACLYRGEAGRQAWSDFRQQVPQFVETLREDRHHVRRLAPLLFAAVRDRPDLVDRTLLTVLRTAYLREELRTAEYRRICRIALAALDTAGAPYIVFRGAALSESVYRDPALRHCHDMNILISERDLSSSAGALEHAGFTLRLQPDADSDIVAARHRSGLPVLLHSRLFQISYYQIDWNEVWGLSVSGTVAGRHARLLAEPHALLQSCYQALHRERLSGLAWACDAYLLMQRCPDLNWDVFLAGVGRSRTELSAHLALEYLAGELESPVPPRVLAHLESVADRVTPTERDVALAIIRRRGSPGLAALLREDCGWRTKLIRLRWILLPSTGYLRWVHGVHHPLLLPMYYAKRVLRYVGRALSSVGARGPRERVRRHVASADSAVDARRS